MENLEGYLDLLEEQRELAEVSHLQVLEKGGRIHQKDT